MKKRLFLLTFLSLNCGYALANEDVVSSPVNGDHAACVTASRTLPENERSAKFHECMTDMIAKMKNCRLQAADLQGAAYDNFMKACSPVNTPAYDSKIGKCSREASNLGGEAGHEAFRECVGMKKPDPAVKQCIDEARAGPEELRREALRKCLPMLKAPRQAAMQ